MNETKFRELRAGVEYLRIKLEKAKTLLGTVCDEYLLGTIDVDGMKISHPSETNAANALALCADYDTWTLLLTIVEDILYDSEKNAKELITKAYGLDDVEDAAS